MRARVGCDGFLTYKTPRKASRQAQLCGGFCRSLTYELPLREELVDRDAGQLGLGQRLGNGINRDRNHLFRILPLFLGSPVVQGVQTPAEGRLHALHEPITARRPARQRRSLQRRPPFVRFSLRQVRLPVRNTPMVRAIRSIPGKLLSSSFKTSHKMVAVPIYKKIRKYRAPAC